MLIAALPASARKSEPKFLARSVSIGGTIYRYQVFVPAHFNRHQQWPVILFLHGSEERGEDGLAQTKVGLGPALRQRPADFPFVVVMPQCLKDKYWTDADMEAMTLAALDASVKEFHGDASRIYLTGVSMGGYGTWDMAVKYSGRFAALVPVCGGLHAPADSPGIHVSMVDDPKIGDPYAETARIIGETPVWIFHGADDPAVPVQESRKMAAALRVGDPYGQYTEYPGAGHNSWDRAYAEPDLPGWLLHNKLKK